MRKPNDHLSRVQLTSLILEALERRCSLPMHDDEFAPAVSVMLEHCGKSGNRSCGPANLDLRRAGLFRHAYQHRTVREVKIPSAVAKAKDTIRTEPGQSLIGKGKFSARIDAGSHRRTATHEIIQRSGARRCPRRKQMHILNNLRDARF